MASIDGTRSVNVASDELFENECGPCKYDGENKEGINYCNNCEEFLCSACTNSHRKFKNSRNHVILPAKDVSKSVIKSEKDHCIVMCTCDQNLETSIYCEDHDEIICKTCKTVKHRKCKTCPISEKSASFDIAKLDTVEEKMLNLLMTIQTFQTDRNADMQKIDILHEDCRQKIKSFRKEFDSFFDNLEQNMISKLEQCTTEKRHVTQRLISTCSTTNQLLGSDSKLLRAAKTSRMKDQMFASTVRLSNRIAECSAVLHDLQEDAEVPVLEFKETSKLMEMRRNIKELGTLNDKRPPCQETSDNNFLDMEVSSRWQVDIRFPEDKETPWISGCDFMPNGDLVLCDTNNKSIKLLNSSFEVKGSLKVKWSPWDVSAVDSFQCIITFIGGEELQYVQVLPELKAGSVLLTDKGCYGIKVAGNEIFVTCRNNPGGEGEIRVLDMEGRKKRSVGMATKVDIQYMFSSPYYLTVGSASGKLFVTDIDTFKLTCLTIDGQIVYEYKDENLTDNRGLCIDTDENVIVCGHSSNNLHVVQSNGKKDRILLSADDGIDDPFSIAYRQRDSHLVVGCMDHNELFVIKLSG